MTDKELKKLQALEKKKYRKKYGLFLIEGKRIVETALEFSAILEKAYFSEAFRENNESTISFLQIAGIPIERISEKQLTKISATKNKFAQNTINLFKIIIIKLSNLSFPFNYIINSF